MNSDIQGKSLEELEAELKRLKKERAEKSGYLSRMLRVSSDREMLELYNRHQQALPELRRLDSMIHDVTVAIVNHPETERLPIRG